MAKRSSERVLTVRLGEFGDGRPKDTLEVRLATLDREDAGLPYHPEYTGNINNRGDRCMADFGAVGTDFIQATWTETPNRWDSDYRLGHYSRYGGGMIDAYKAEALSKTLNWLGKQVARAMEQRGRPTTADEAVMLMADAVDAALVFVYFDGRWHKYSNAGEYREAIRRLERATFKPKQEVLGG